MIEDGTVAYKIIGGDHKEYGPATPEEVRQWIRDGRVSGQTLVHLIGSGEWKMLSTFSEFGEDLKEQALRFGDSLSRSGAAGGSAPSAPATLQIVGEPTLRVGHCLAASARLFATNFGVIAGGCMLTWMLSVACQFIPFIGGMLFWFLQGAFYGGLYLVFLKRIRGEDATIGEVFAGFGPMFMQLSLAGLLVTLLSAIGYLFCFVPGLYLTVAWVFAIPLVADKRLEFWSAMELSRRTASRVWFSVAVLLLVAFLPMVLMHFYTQFKIFSISYPLFEEVFGGRFDVNKFQELMTTVTKASIPLLLIGKVVLLFNLPFAIGAVAYAYEDLFGTGSTRKS